VACLAARRGLHDIKSRACFVTANLVCVAPRRVPALRRLVRIHGNKTMTWEGRQHDRYTSQAAVTRVPCDSYMRVATKQSRGRTGSDAVRHPVFALRAIELGVG
jgi:hypothetical protein